MLFILAIDPLQQIISLAAQHNILKLVLPRSANLRYSLYVDDAAIFANPDHTELHALHKILTIFGKCSGLITNLHKTEIFPVRCQEVNMEQIMVNFPGKLCAFPCK